jgi:membrane protein
LMAFALWLAASAGLQVYLRFFGSYTTVYGSLGAVIVLMLWFYLFGVAILVGGELNSVLEQAAAAQGNPQAKHPGQKEPTKRIIGP